MYLLNVGPHPFNRYGTFLTGVIGAGIVPCLCRRDLMHWFENLPQPHFFNPSFSLFTSCFSNFIVRTQVMQWARRYL